MYVCGLLLAFFFLFCVRLGVGNKARDTYPLSPVASTKFFHCGCSHIKSAASAVSVHQHKCLLNNSFSVNLGRKVEIAFLMLTSDASGYVSVGCFAADRGTEIRLGAVAP